MKDKKTSGYEVLFIWSIILGCCILISVIFKSFLSLVASSLGLLFFNFLISIVELLRRRNNKMTYNLGSGNK